jgi:Helix-turn-helix domain
VSIRAFRWALKEVYDRNDPKSDGGARQLTSPEAFVLVMLANHYNDDWGRAWPSRARIERETSLSAATVKRSLKSLQDHKGLIIAEQWMLNDGAQWMPNRYLLPTFNPSIRPAYEQPVIASLSYEAGAPIDDCTVIPGTNLVVETFTLSPDPWPIGDVTVNRGVGSP